MGGYEVGKFQVMKAEHIFWVTCSGYTYDNQTGHVARGCANYQAEKADEVTTNKEPSATKQIAEPTRDKKHCAFCQCACDIDPRSAVTGSYVLNTRQLFDEVDWNVEFLTALMNGKTFVGRMRNIYAATWARHRPYLL